MSTNVSAAEFVGMHFGAVLSQLPESVAAQIAQAMTRVSAPSNNVKVDVRLQRLDTNVEGYDLVMRFQRDDSKRIIQLPSLITPEHPTGVPRLITPEHPTGVPRSEEQKEPAVVQEAVSNLAEADLAQLRSALDAVFVLAAIVTGLSEAAVPSLCMDEGAGLVHKELGVRVEELFVTDNAGADGYRVLSFVCYKQQ